MTLFFSFLVPLLLGGLTAPLAMRLSHAVGAVDVPGERHIHKRLTPRGGGLSLAFSFFVGALLFLRELPLLAAATAVGALLFALGLTDDIVSLSPLGKLFCEGLFFSLVPLFGIRPTALTLLPSLSLSLSPAAGSLFCILFLLFLTNGVNMIDGLDTLSGGASAISALGFLAIALLTENGEGARLSLLVLGAILGFLPYNRHPARLFLGDGGALLLGFLLGLLGLTVFPSRVPLLPLFLLLLTPLFDLFFSFFRRLLRGKNPFMADKSHLHHRLLSLGIPYRRSVLFLHLLSLLGVLLSLLLLFPASSFPLF